MTDFEVTIRVHTEDHDADIMLQFPEQVMQRFEGTAIKIDSIQTTNLTLVNAPKSGE